MPDLAKYQGHIDAIKATVNALHKVYGWSGSMTAHHAALSAFLDDLIADNPGLVRPADGDPKPPPS